MLILSFFHIFFCSIKILEAPHTTTGGMPVKNSADCLHANCTWDCRSSMGGGVGRTPHIRRRNLARATVRVRATVNPNRKGKMDLLPCPQFTPRGKGGGAKGGGMGQTPNLLRPGGGGCEGRFDETSWRVDFLPTNPVIRTQTYPLTPRFPMLSIDPQGVERDHLDLAGPSPSTYVEGVVGSPLSPPSLHPCSPPAFLCEG